MYNLPTAAFMYTIFCTCTIKKLHSLKPFETINDMKSGSSVFSYYIVDILIITIKSMMKWAANVAHMGED
jgi:hypothetical protein